MKFILTGLMTILILGTMNSVFAMEQTSGPSHSSQVEVHLPNGMTGIASPLYTTQGAPANYVVPAGGTLDGVADILWTSTTGPGTFRCSGSLLQSDPLGGDNDMIILTAAHCVDLNLDGTVDLASANVRFERTGGDQTISVNVGQTMVAPGWDGQFLNGDDLAILVLNSAPSPDVNRYTWDTNPADDIGGDANQVGYGRSGMLSQGDILSSGTKRAIQNDRDGTADATAIAFGAGAITPGYGIVLDGDNGLAANDACAIYGLCAAGLGNGINEGLSAGGDSGGPSFNGVPDGNSPDEVQLVTSWGGTFFGPVSADINLALDSSAGELSVHTRTSIYASWIESTLKMKNKFEPPVQPPGPQIGGELLPIDTTALFVSGLYSSAMWLAPIGAGIAGTGYYLIQRLYK